MAHSRIGHLRLAGCGAISQAIVRRTEMRASFYDLSRHFDLRLAGIETLVGKHDTRIDIRCAAVLYLVRGLIQTRHVPIARPFPDVSICQKVLMRKLSLPRVNVFRFEGGSQHTPQQPAVGVNGTEQEIRREVSGFIVRLIFPQN